MARNVAIAASTLVLASSAFATVSSTLVADRYIVKEGSGASARFYSVLDVYIKGNNLADTSGGVSGISASPVTIATTKATGTSLTRGTNGGITGGTITSDIFKQAGGSGWNPNYGGTDGAAWDSWVGFGNRKQNATITNRGGTVREALAGGLTSFEQGSGQLNVGNSNFINNGSSSGWLCKEGSNPYSTGGTAENPFARVSLYNAHWASTYPTLDRSPELLVSKGSMYNGASSTTLAESAAAAGAAGTSLDFHWMLGRFAIEVTGMARPGEEGYDPIALQVQFNMTGRNGSTTSTESGTTFTGSSTSTTQYRVNQFFAFAVPAPGAMALVGLAGLISRRRSH